MAFPGEGFSDPGQTERLGLDRAAYSLEAAVRTIRFFGYTPSEERFDNRHVDNPFLMQFGNFVGTTDKKGILEIKFENAFPTIVSSLNVNLMPFPSGLTALLGGLISIELSSFKIEGPKNKKILVFFIATGF